MRCDDPVVLREAWHVLVHLRPAPVVARVTSGAPGVNPNDVVCELDVARHALRGGAPVVRPSDLLDPGPHVHDGRTLVFWEYVDSTGELDPRAAGEGLRAIHEALADYDGELPRGGRADEVEEMLAPMRHSADVDLLRELSSRPLPEGQALHGDAHLDNCLPGPIWHDLETACRGPREYDLAALLLSDRPEAALALEAYGDHDADLVQASLPVYAAWVCASFMVATARRPDASAALERQLGYLRRISGG
ncbi:MAG TPA: phosphotransferase [Gaiellaceae bacterium]|nr:phosphotransferase [Gaiellaceae bacterium]